MYRGFQTYRHFLNAKLHALSAVICGDDRVLDIALERYGVKSVKELSFAEARGLYASLRDAARQSAESIGELRAAIGEGPMTVGQRKLIIKLTKYEFNWTPEATFSYILDMFPDHRKRMSLWEVQNSELHKLYRLLNSKEADRVIKRLLGIQKRNRETSHV